MGMSISGLASGIDSDSIIAQLLALEEQRIFMIQKRIAEEEESWSGRVLTKHWTFGLPTVYGKLDAAVLTAVCPLLNIKLRARTI